MERVITALAFLCFSWSVHADSWRAPRSLGKSSASGSYVVRVEPGTSKGDVIGYSGASKGPYAAAEWYRYDGQGYALVHRATLLNPIAPVDIEITDGGILITLDNWHNRGLGVVLAIYAPDGRVVKQYTLRDLYSERNVKRIRTTVSSIHWRCEGFPAVFDTPRKLWIEDSLGGRFLVDVETGDFIYDAKRGSCANSRP